MADGTIIQVGSFVSTGANVTIQLRSGVDWMQTYNYTQASTATQYTSPFSYWQLGMAAGDCIYQYKNAGTTIISDGTCAVGPAANPGAIGGYTYIDTTLNAFGAPIAITAISAAGVVSTGNTAGLVANSSVVRINNAVGANQVGGIPFLVTAVVANTSFTLGTLVASGNIAAAAAPGASAVYFTDPYFPMFVPARVIITNISQAASAVVTTSAPHNYVVGQEVRLNVPNIPNLNSMYQANGLIGEITAVGSSTTFTININTTAFTAFAYPLTTNYPFTPAYVTPVGEGEDSTIANPNLLDDAVFNQSYIGMILAGGLGSPAGQNGDVIYWKAGKSFNT